MFIYHDNFIDIFDDGEGVYTFEVVRVVESHGKYGSSTPMIWVTDGERMEKVNGSGLSYRDWKQGDEITFDLNNNL